MCIVNSYKLYSILILLSSFNSFLSYHQHDHQKTLKREGHEIQGKKLYKRTAAAHKQKNNPILLIHNFPFCCFLFYHIAYSNSRAIFCLHLSVAVSIPKRQWWMNVLSSFQIPRIICGRIKLLLYPLDCVLLKKYGGTHSIYFLAQRDRVRK